MNEEFITAEINSFFEKANIGKSDRKKLPKRLSISINFLLGLGVGLDDIPTDAHYEQLEKYLHTLTYGKGNLYTDGVIRDWVNRTKDFYSVRNGNNSDSQMSIPKIIEPASTGGEDTTDNNAEDTNAQAPIENMPQQPAFFPVGAEQENNDTPKGEQIMTDNETITENSAVTEQTQPIAQLQPSSPVEASRKAGRPESTGRSEKFTLYMTPELWKKITMLADLDEVKITDFMNNALEDYCDNQRADDIEFLYTLERRKQERRLQKARN